MTLEAKAAQQLLTDLRPIEPMPQYQSNAWMRAAYQLLMEAPYDSPYPFYRR